jgi:hypothetical protein
LVFEECSHDLDFMVWRMVLRTLYNCRRDYDNHYYHSWSQNPWCAS